MLRRAFRDAVIVDELISSNPVERAQAATSTSPGTRHRTVTSLMTKLIRAHKPELPHARLHDLRHLHATTLLLSGVSVHVVAARLGHADPAITFTFTPT